VTTAAACAAAAAATGSVPLTLGIAAGGFFIDLDHAFDYVVFDGQRDLRPSTFLHYYLEGRTRRVVLALHSYELFVLLGGLAWSLDALPLWGYLIGALMHLALDISFNGESVPRSIVPFYSFAYRAANRFDARRLLGGPRVAPAGFWPAFFALPNVAARWRKTARLASRPIVPGP
jgi:hypothetical protein